MNLCALKCTLSFKNKKHCYSQRYSWHQLEISDGNMIEIDV